MVDTEDAELHPVAVAIGEAWADELMHSLRSADREIIGPWPGTLREARTRVYIGLRKRLSLTVIDKLTQVAYVAARRGWQQITAPDPEP